MTHTVYPRHTNSSSSRMTTILYVLNLLGYITGGTTAWVALLIASCTVNSIQDPMNKAHYQYQIWTHLYIIGSAILLGVLFALVESKLPDNINGTSKFNWLLFLVLISGVSLFCFYGYRMIRGLYKSMKGEAP